MERIPPNLCIMFLGKRYFGPLLPCSVPKCKKLKVFGGGLHRKYMDSLHGQLRKRNELYCRANVAHRARKISKSSSSSPNGPNDKISKSNQIKSEFLCFFLGGTSPPSMNQSVMMFYNNTSFDWFKL